MKRALVSLPHRTPRLPHGSPLDSAPDNEQGVVYLFSHLARKFGLHVDRVQTGFPDCIAYDRAGKRVRIEFEYRSRNFRSQGHDPRGCDCIVCWIHDWHDVPRRIRVIELRKEFRQGFNIWLQPVAGEYAKLIGRLPSGYWSVPSQASKDDLVLFYKARPYKYISDIFRLTSEVRHEKADWKPGKDWEADVRRVATLKAPLHLDELRNEPIVKSAGFVRGDMRGRFKATPYWPVLYRMIIDRNPGVRRALEKFAPERFA